MTFDVDTALEEFLRKEFRVFHHLPDVVHQRLATAALPPDVIPNDSGGELSVSVAAVDASDQSKENADLVCIAATDDRTVAEEALDSIKWNGKLVLSEGSFDFETQLTRASGGGKVLIEGMGQDTTIITTSTSGLGALFRAETGITWTWKDLTMDGADLGQSSLTTSIASLAVLNMVRVTVKDFTQEGVDIFSTSGSGRMVDCLFFSNTDHGFRVEESNIDFFYCRFKNNGGAGLAIVKDSAQMIIGCWFSDNATEGIVTSNAVGGSCSAWLLMDNRFISNGTDALRLQDGSDWAILNNYFTGHTNSLKFGAGGFGDSADNWINGNYSTDTNFIAGDGDPQLIGVNSVGGVVTLGDGAGLPASDSTAIHDNIAAEISPITEKVTPIAADLVVIEDSAAANVKKRVQVGNLPSAGGTALTTKGDLHGYDTGNTRIPVGATDGHALIVDSASALGVKYAEVSGTGQGFLIGFGEDNLAASLTDSQLYRTIQGVQLQIPTVTTHAGSIIGISVASSEARTAGTATFEVFKNGIGTGLTTVLDATDTQYAFGVQAEGVDTFAAGDRIDVRVTTDGSWAPTTADVEVSVTIGTTPGSAVPEWVLYLAGRQSDETPHADDDFFGSDSIADYTEQTVSGSANWAIARGLLSVKFNSQTAGDVSALLKPITSYSAPMTIESRMRSWTDYTASYDYEMGIIFTSGTATGSFLYGFSYKTENDESPQIHSVDGTLTALTSKAVGSSSNVPIAMGGLYMRVTSVSANNWAISWSPIDKQWTDYGLADDVSSFTPTHFGFFVSSDGGTVETIAAWDYLRVSNTDESL